MSAATGARRPPTLRPGAVVERRIAGGARHLYRLPLTVGDFLHLGVDQRGVDVAVRLSGPGGRLLREVDSPTDDVGPETLLLVATETGEHRLEVRAFPGRGGRYAAAVRALRPATAADWARAAAAAAFAAAEELAAAGDVAAADAAFRRAGAAWRRLGDPAGQAHVEYRLGGIATRRGDLGAAADHHRRAAALFAAAGEARWRGIALTVLGTALFQQGELRAAAPFFDEALALRRAAGDTAGEALLLHNLGDLHQLLGEPERALELYEGSLERWRQRGEEERGLDTFHNLGVLFLTLGRPREALDPLRRAAAAARRAGDERRRTTTLLQIGRAEEGAGSPAKSEAIFRQALAAARRSGDRRGIARALSHLGVLARRRGDLGAARRRHEAALRLVRELGEREWVGAALTSLGAVDLAAGEPTAARDRFLAAVPYLTADGDRGIRADNLLGRAQAELALGRLQAGREAAEAAVALVDAPRHRLGSLALTASYSAAVQPYFDAWVEALMALHRRQPAAGWDRRALAASERARARSFLDAAAMSQVAARRAAGGLAAEEARQRRRLNALDAERLALRQRDGPPALAAALEREIGRTLIDLDRLGRRLRASDPRHAALIRLEPLTAAAIQRRLPADAALLEVKLGAERSYLWVVTAGGVESHELPGRRELEAAARRAYELLTRSHRHEAAAPARQALCELSRTLLVPVRALAERRRLLVVAEGALLYLPLAALPDPAALARDAGCPAAPPLAATHAVVQLPSASLLAALAAPGGRRRWDGEVAVVADPAFAPGGPFRRLPFARREAQAVLAQAPAHGVFAALGLAASRETVLSGRLAGFRRVHFATHGVVDPLHPELSGLVLSTIDAAGRPRDGFVRAHEIAALELPAELVVLSACRTALGQEIRGEGLVGLTRSFFEAGARSLLVSLWSVDDRATAELMRRFYGELFTAGRPPAEALARAQAAMAAEPRWRAPSRWAGFVLQGPLEP